MTSTLRHLCCLALWLIGCICGSAKEVKDTLYSTNGDRVIENYNMTLSGGQVTVKFNSVLKKLGQRTQEKYKKLDEVCVVIFDRNGNFRDLIFEGQATQAFMVPSNITYTPSADGYFLLQDNPMLQFSVQQGEEANLSIPLYLAHYEKKRHYKVFGQCGMLQLAVKPTNGKGTGAAQGYGGGEHSVGETTITSEELTDEGLAPAEEANIRINSINSMLQKANKLPLSEELTHEVSMLRELRFKITDESVNKQISATLEAYDNKKQELESQAEANEQAAAAEKAQKDLLAKAQTDSLSAMSALQAAKDKKEMMWLIGGLGGLALLIFGGKQVVQTIKNSQLQKAQRQMMEGISKMATGGMSNVNANSPFGNMPGMKQAEQAVTGKLQRALSKEGEAAKQKLQEMKKPKQPTAQSATPTADKLAPKKPSLNDQIPAKYKRWRKPGQSPNKNVTI